MKRLTTFAALTAGGAFARGAFAHLIVITAPIFLPVAQAFGAAKG